MGVNEYSKSAVLHFGSPVAQLPTMRTTLSGFAPLLVCAAMGEKLPIASTSTLPLSSTCTGSKLTPYSVSNPQA